MKRIKPNQSNETPPRDSRDPESMIFVCHSLSLCLWSESETLTEALTDENSVGRAADVEFCVLDSV